jgi:predicted RNA binding protein YcfA (HicA-like mRNA interferase family)
MTQRLPALSAREVIRALERAGFAVSRTSGSHCRLVHTTDPARKITVPVHSGDLKRGTLRGIIAQAGFTVKEFLALLRLLKR